MLPKHNRRIKYLVAAAVGVTGILGLTLASRQSQSGCIDSGVCKVVGQSLENVVDDITEHSRFMVTGLPKERCVWIDVIIGKEKENDSYFVAEIATSEGENVCGNKLITYQPIIEHLFGKNPLDYNNPNLKICWQTDSLLSSKLQRQTMPLPKYRSIYLSFDGTAPNRRKTVQIADMDNDRHRTPDIIELVTKKDSPHPHIPHVTINSVYTMDGIFINPKNSEAIKADRDYGRYLQKLGDEGKVQLSQIDLRSLTDQEIIRLRRDYQELIQLGK